MIFNFNMIFLHRPFWFLTREAHQSVTTNQCDQKKKSPIAYKSCPKMISIEKW